MPRASPLGRATVSPARGACRAPTGHLVSGTSAWVTFLAMARPQGLHGWTAPCRRGLARRGGASPRLWPGASLLRRLSLAPWIPSSAPAPRWPRTRLLGRRIAARRTRVLWLSRRSVKVAMPLRCLPDQLPNLSRGWAAPPTLPASLGRAAPPDWCQSRGSPPAPPGMPALPWQPVRPPARSSAGQLARRLLRPPPVEERERPRRRQGMPRPSSVGRHRPCLPQPYRMRPSSSMRDLPPAGLARLS
mmetsp:Transcript_6144/g.19336  ORF Transcript_6144/g.19336 Transcript_6144/m.19336 type:complete len:246 (+) Transcript_6144:180-917(+)